MKDVFLLLRARAEDDDERGNWSFHSHQFRAISGVTEALRGPIARRVLNARRRCVSHTQVSKVTGSIWVDKNTLHDLSPKNSAPLHVKPFKFDYLPNRGLAQRTGWMDLFSQVVVRREISARENLDKREDNKGVSLHSTLFPDGAAEFLKGKIQKSTLGGRRGREGEAGGGRGREGLRQSHCWWGKLWISLDWI